MNAFTMGWLTKLLTRLLSIGADPMDDRDERRKKQGLVLMCLFSLVGMPLDALIGLLQSVQVPLFSLAICTIVPAVVLAVLAQTKRRRPIQEVMLSTLLFLPLTLHAYAGGTHATDTLLIWAGVPAILGVFLCSFRWTMGYFLTYFISAYTLIWLDPYWTGAATSPSLAFFDVDFFRRSMVPIWFPTSIFAVTLLLQRELEATRKALNEAREMGHYVLKGRLGAGGMGEVWRASHQMLARPAAIKLIRPDALHKKGADPAEVFARFEREARATARLTSPHTIQIYDYGRTDDGTFYYAMELLDGLDLYTLVKRYGPLPPERVTHLLIQICSSLADAHDADFVHRDIKPANVFLCRMGRQVDYVKVLDFGLVTLRAPDGSEDNSLTRDHILGTPTCMGPEVATGGQVGPYTDLYALGCVAYKLLTGQPVFTGETALAIIAAHVNKTPPPVSETCPDTVPPALERIITSCLAKDPAMRPESADVMAAQLRGVIFDNPWTETRAIEWWKQHMPTKAAGAEPTAPTITDGAPATYPLLTSRLEPTRKVVRQQFAQKK